MSRVKVLSPFVADQIAAGEVVISHGRSDNL